jgi:hypothetical protein
MRAEDALYIWWKVYGHLLVWAQSQIIGHEIAQDSPKLVDK